ncbi:ATP synthase F1 subunit gamma [Clostridium omnivorum]|uniref:ATP synthase gamma chain n=1 Tax=Clostridium omnivorum TaxID=1604902 RepID=A0ABQ5N0Z2_9CLOT|nr:ATP synthase F1 subunit gamma [Clostridium sp. E14]GLC28750.1 ATP synthase gamma chain [Clostridium sp. E14]
MAGSGLIGIKRRIKSVTNTKKITKAMGLVATAKLRKSREKLDINNNYYDSFEGIIKDLVDSHEGYNIYKSGNESSKKLYIVITSDSGLCGGFNGNIVNRTIDQLKVQNGNYLLNVAGEKGIAYFERFKFNINKKYVDISDLPTLKEARDISNDALGLYENGEVGEVILVYTRFISPVKQEVVFEKLLPLGTKSEDEYNYEKYIKFEPDIDSILNNAAPIYIKEKILNLMIHSKSSEQSTRMSAMDGATKNANDLLDKYKLQYNRMRQGAITQEISEIVGGAEAQK